MNRPIKPKPSQELSFEEYMSAQSTYETEIEKYCDKLEKALDKACAEINSLTLEFVSSSNYIQITANEYDDFEREKQWKEWFLKDE